MAEKTHISLVGHIRCLNDLQIHLAGVAHTVGKIFQIFRFKIVISLIAQHIGDFNSHGIERIEAIAIATLKIAIGACHRVDNLADGSVLIQIFQFTQHIGRIHIHIVGDAGFLFI